MRLILIVVILISSLFSQNQRSPDSFSIPLSTNITVASSRNQSPIGVEEDKTRQLVDSLASVQQKNERLIALVKAQKDSLQGKKVATEFWEENKQEYKLAIETAFWVLGFWFLIMLLLLFYGLYRFHFTGGLSRKKYYEVVKLIDEEQSIPLENRAVSYPQNPYKNETFGLPRGTVRGFLTLTLLVGNCLVLYVSPYAPPTSIFDNRVEYITTAFLMMIAFYFGSKAMDVFKVKEETKRVTTPGVGEGSSLTPTPRTRRVPRIDLVPVISKPTTSLKHDFKHQTPTMMTKTESNKLKLEIRALALTTYFETGKKIEEAYGTVAGNFDNMGISIGCLQWNLGQETLQPILKNYFAFGDDMWQSDPNLIKFKEILDLPLNEQIRWAISIQEHKNGMFSIPSKWEKSFENLGQATKQFQLQACEERFKIAKSWCTDLSLISERAFALMFDINVQNGILFRRIPKRNIDVRRSIEQRIQNAGSPTEEQKLVIVAEERTKASLPQWQKVVLDRKLAIALGRGKVYGVEVNLDDYDISINRAFA